MPVSVLEISVLFTGKACSAYVVMDIADTVDYVKLKYCCLAELWSESWRMLNGISFKYDGRRGNP